jgi:recombination protein RecT
MPTRANTDAAKDALAKTSTPSAGTTIAQYLEAQKPAILAALPRNVDVDRFTRIVLTTVRKNPKLLQCDPLSILAATMQSAQLGLEPGSGLGEAYIIPYKREATFQMGYRGVIKLARNSGDLSAIWAEAVYAGDVFRVVMGTEPRIIHEPDFTVERGTYEAMTHVYAVAKLSSGETQYAVMTKAEIEAHKTRYSRGASSSDSPWKDPLGAVEMAKKTVVLRLGKMLPLSAEVARAFASDGTVRRELSADMSSLPDVEDEAVEPEAIGAVEVDAVVAETGELVDESEADALWPETE